MKNCLIVVVTLGLAVSSASSFGQGPLLEYDFNELNALALSSGTLEAVVTLRNAAGNITNLHSAAGAGLGDGFAFDNTSATGMGWPNVGGGAVGFLDMPRSLKSVTVSGWMKNVSAAWASGARILFSRDIADTQNFDLMWDGTGRLRLDLTMGPTPGGWGFSPDNTYSPATNQWTFFAVTFDGTAASSQMKFYVGFTNTAATLAGSSTVTNTLASLPGLIGIGNVGTWGNVGPFDGLLDDLRVYGSTNDATGALTLAQVEAVRQSGLLNRGPIAFWKFDESSGTTAVDSYLFNHAGTLLNGPTRTATGLSGGALILDGVNDYVRVNDANRLDVTNQFTFSLWVKPARGGVLQALLSKDGVGTDTTGAYNVYLTTTLAVQYEVNNVASLTSAANVVTSNQWHHIAVTYDATAAPQTRLYVNGLSVASGNLPAPSVLGTRLLLGRLGTGSYFKGTLDEVQLFNKALPPAAVGRLSARDYPPVAALVAPAPGATLSGLVTLQAAASDDVAVQEVEFRVDGAYLGTARQSPYQLTFNSATLANGAHTISAFARDAAGQVSTNYDDQAYKQVRFIEWGWDMPTTAYVRTNVAAMEQAPFDGVVVQLVSTQTPPVSFSAAVFTTNQFTLAHLQADIDHLSSTPFSKFTEMFAIAYTSTADAPNIPDWFDDWTAPLTNINLLGRVAKDGKLKGVLLDTETYGPTNFQYSVQKYVSTKTLAQYQAQARVRGQQVINQLNTTYPGITVLCTYGYALSANPHYDLLAAFFTGLVEAAGTNTVIHELGEGAYLATKDQQLQDLKAGLLTAAAQTLPTAAAVDKYFVGFGKYLDSDGGQWTNNVLAGNLQANFYPPQIANTNSPGWQEVLMGAGANTERYVWIYSERPNWWTGDWLPAAYQQATQTAQSSLTNRTTSAVVVTISN